MRKLIENVIPYPIDCEVRLGSILAALLTSQNRDLTDEMIVCDNTGRRNGEVGEPCTRCGNCRGWTIREQHYHRLQNEYAFVSGQALLQFDMSGKDPASRDELQTLSRVGDYLGFMLGYAGYEYRTVEAAAGKAAVFGGIRESIDNGMPVLLQYRADQLWLLVTGYDDTMALYGYDGGAYADYYQKMTPAPHRYEGKLFHATNWYDAMARAVIVGAKCTPKVSLDDVVVRNASLMKLIFGKGEVFFGRSCFDGNDYYGRAVEYILDDGNYRDEGDNLRTQAKLIDDFIGVPISGRSIVSWFLRDQMKRNREGKHRERFARIFGCCCDIHEICWVAWRGVGAYEREPERFHAKLTDPLYRKMLAGVVGLVRYKDWQVYEGLRDCAGAVKARP